MQKRLSRYTVKYWANAFFKTLKNKSIEKKDPSTIKIKNGLIKIIQDEFNKAKKRLLIMMGLWLIFITSQRLQRQALKY